MIRIGVLTGLLLAGLATNVLAATPAEIDAEFKLAIADAREGRLDAAIKRLRHLASETQAPRIKLELGVLLLRTGDNSDALTLLRQVYQEKNTPQKVRRNMLPFIEEAELRVMRIRYGARIVTDSNPSKVVEGGTIYFNGIPLEYQPPARKKTAYGIEPWFSAEKLWQSGYLTKFNAAARLFEDEDLRTGRFQLAAARRLAAIPGLFVQASLDAEIAKHASYMLPSLETWKRFRLSDTAGVGLGGQAGYMFSQEADISGPFYRGYVFGDWTFQPNATLFGKLSGEMLDSHNDFYSHVSTKVDFGVNLTLANLQMTPQLSFKQTQFAEFNPFWGNRRKDKTIRPEVAFSSEKIEWKGIRPEVSVFYEWRKSNIDIYEYDQIGGYVNLRKLF